MKGENLCEKLKRLSYSDYYPFHMPGHKRNGCDDPLDALYEMDITEIDGFDNLHEPEGILQNGMEDISNIYGAEKSYYLINGSTCGILSAICSCTSRNDTLLLARNSHKSAYHAVFLNELRAEYLYPEYLNEFEISAGIPPDAVERALQLNADIKVVFITSPTYDGIISDVRTIAEICHKRGVVCIVDEAHGAHLGLWGEGVENACRLGADIVIHSIHKTLPAPTQTALLHVCGRLADRERLEFYLRIFQTSSPSYVLMAGIDQCFRILEEKGVELYQKFQINRNEFLKQTEKLEKIYIFTEVSLGEKKKQKLGILDVDVTKLLISVKDTEYTGKRLYDELRQKYHLQMEMYGESYVIAIITIMDTKEGFDRLGKALHLIDKKLGIRKNGLQIPPFFQEPIKKMTIYKANNMPKEQLLPEEAAGRTAGNFLSLYPPGIPIMVPGEEYTDDIIRYILNCRELGYKVQGLDEISKKVTVVKL